MTVCRYESHSVLSLCLSAMRYCRYESHSVLVLCSTAMLVCRYESPRRVALCASPPMLALSDSHTCRPAWRRGVLDGVVPSERIQRFCVPADNQIRKHVFVNTLKSWSEAQSYCRENHTDLATVRSQEEAKQLFSIPGVSLIDTAWIGLYRDDTQNWQWSNGYNVIYKNWTENLFCVSINSVGQWEDRVCGEMSAFMCYQETNNIAKRYTLIQELKTWTEAQQYCREYHTDLVSIKNASENEDLVRKAQGVPFWIGLFNEPWKWSHQGDNYTFHYWKILEPNNWEGKQKCVRMFNSGEWGDKECDLLYPFFCYDDAIPSDPPSTPLSEEAESSSPPSIPVSQDAIPSDPPSAPLSEDATPSDPPSTPLSEEAESSSPPSIPVSQDAIPSDPPSAPLSEDATPSDPPSTPLSEDAIPSDPPSTSLSEDATPSDPPSTPLSEDPKTTSPPSTPISQEAESSSPPSTPVSQAGTPVPEALHLISHSMVWPEAWQYCKDRYTDLVSLTGLAAQNRVSELVRNSTASRFWIGLHRTVVYDNWYWVAGEDKRAPLNYTNWAPGEPNNPYYEHCGEMVLGEDGGAEWNDLCCYEKLPFICFREYQHL
ncbi:uncharacterized protein LOC121304139 [Polyodon spathula]|uniref:uncharacterized protein LOC121304139 n=1 Tax=Polyodon spathula TaxID=7913 RepID=UPI001B7DA147|nr:uncharacterized protein LOC121304139 [Polyodon spathula]